MTKWRLIHHLNYPIKFWVKLNRKFSKAKHFLEHAVTTHFKLLDKAQRMYSNKTNVAFDKFATQYQTTEKS